ncbi:XdhC family protein [Streptomyces sp. OE57]|uniref:XdhC family protein n=1 Tax=Streptomyces lacaronensis TaxID=3379885 RepID=UPI0039B74696
MLEIATELLRWAAEGRDFAVATVVAVGGSAPRPPGAALAVDADGTAVGSVSGGCVEGAVYDLCVQALQDGRVVREQFGYSDEDAFAVGLACGGVIDVLVTPVHGDAPYRRVFEAALSAAASGKTAAAARVVRGPDELLGRALLVRADGAYEGGLGGDPQLDRTAAAETRALLATGRTGTVDFSEDGSHCPGGVTLFVQSSVEPPRMIVFGAIDFAAALVRTGKDARFDVPLLEEALRLPVAFVGAMGSRRTHEDRNRRLREAGVTEEELARLHSPIGLDPGARTPEETALSIAAEIVAARRGGSGTPLTGAPTPIHHDRPEGPGRVTALTSAAG